MAKLPGDRAAHLSRGLALALAWLAVGPSAGAAVDLVGTWHVLVHYKDSRSNNPDAERWLDRVWVFEPSGSRLRWTDFPIVVFDSEQGRFERRSTGQYARTLSFWEPSPQQRANVRFGLQVNERGSRSKSLRGSPESGWASTGRARPSSASVITYSESWSVEGLSELPVFTFREQLGSGRSDSLEGITRYAADRVSENGYVVSGTYVRDGHKTGRFRMTRSGETRDLEGSGKTQGQRLMEAFFGDWAEALSSGSDDLERELQKRLADGELTDEDRARLREEIRSHVAEGVQKLGGDPGELEFELDRITEQIQQQVEQGRSMEEIGRMIQDGEIAQ